MSKRSRDIALILVAYGLQAIGPGVTILLVKVWDVDVAAAAAVSTPITLAGARILHLIERGNKLDTKEVPTLGDDPTKP